MNVLFLSTEEFKQYIATDAGTSYDLLKGFIEEATVLYITDLLGPDQLNTLQAAYTAGSGTPAGQELQDLLPYVQRPLAYYAMHLAVDQLAVSVGNIGIVESSGDNSNPAPKYKLDALKQHYLRQADTHAEKLLEFLETNATPLVYTDWHTSSYNTIATGALLSTAKQATEYIDIDNSRRLWLRVKKRATQIETAIISKLIGAAQYSELVAEIKAGTLTADNTALLSYLRPIIAKKALYETLPAIKIGITGSGITLHSSSDGYISKAAASAQDIKLLMYSLKEGELGYMADIAALNNYIITNIDTYPLIKAATVYTARAVPGPSFLPVNDINAKHFSV